MEKKESDIKQPLPSEKTGQIIKEAANNSHEDNYRAIFDAANDTIFVLDIETFDIVDVNRKGCEMFIAQKDYITSQGLAGLSAGNAPYRKDDIQKYLDKAIHGEPQIFEWMVKDKAGHLFWVEINLKRAIIRGRYRILAIVRDINERKDSERRLKVLNAELVKSNRIMKKLSLKDFHTGLYNYRYLGETIDAEFHKAVRLAHPLSVIMVDIDNFKSINDVYGQKFGDLVIKQLADKLKERVRRYDVVVRYGGEEFVVISPGTNHSSVMLMGHRLLYAINNNNFGNKRHVVKIKPRISLVSYPSDSSILNGMDLVDLAEKILRKTSKDDSSKILSSTDLNEEKPFSAASDRENSRIRLFKEKIETVTRKGNEELARYLFSFAKAAGEKSKYKAGSTDSMVNFATEIAKAMKLPSIEIEHIQDAVVLHDLGNIGINDDILLKRTPLTKIEFEEVKKHTQIGADIIRPVHFMREVIPLVLHHHERWDGEGYPSGLRYEEIPLGARIISLVDVYNALISDRPYRKAFPKNKAHAIIQKGAGTSFDPEMTDLFLKMAK